MKYQIYIITILLLLSLYACEEESVTLNSFPTIAGNIDAINTSYNEYNETFGGFSYDYISFIYSSDEDSDGDNLDFKNIYLGFYHNPDILNFTINDEGFSYFDSALVNINSSYMESDAYLTYDNYYTSDVFVFTSNKEDNSDIFYSIGNYSLTSWSEPVSLEKMNTENNEADFIAYSSGVIFTSNESGNYNIYKIDVDLTQTFKEWIELDEDILKENFDILNSDFDDICPNVNGNYIIFASNREGGYGGYDLYYSHYENGDWTPPVNFGADINSEYDEINPKTIYYRNYKNDLMFFSSDRTGGKGGFDIYYAGIPKLTN
jgi:hypothetical protein